MRFIRYGSIKKKMVLLMIAAIVSTGGIAFGQNDSVTTAPVDFESFRVSTSNAEFVEPSGSRAHTGDSVVTIKKGLESSLTYSTSTLYASVYKQQKNRVTSEKTIRILGKYNLEYPEGIYWLGDGFYLRIEVDKYSRATVVYLTGTFEP